MASITKIANTTLKVSDRLKINFTRVNFGSLGLFKEIFEIKDGVVVGLHFKDLNIERKPDAPVE